MIGVLIVFGGPMLLLIIAHSLAPEPEDWGDEE